MNLKSARSITAVALMAALVFLATASGIRVPIGGTDAIVHLGNAFCILAGLLLGGLPGGLAAGIGSGLFDLVGGYAADAAMSFFNKFVMGFVAGAVMWNSTSIVHRRGIRAALAAFCADLIYLVLYMLKNTFLARYIQGIPWNGVWPILAAKTLINLFNAFAAFALSLIFYSAIFEIAQRLKISRTK